MANSFKTAAVFCQLTSYAGIVTYADVYPSHTFGSLGASVLGCLFSDRAVSCCGEGINNHISSLSIGGGPL